MLRSYDLDYAEFLFVAQNGGPPPSESRSLVPPAEVIVITPFFAKQRYKDLEFLRQKYVAEGLSIAQIAGEIGSSKEAVRNGLLRFDIPLREPRRHHGRPGQARFGVKVVRGRSQPHLFESNVIETIQGLRAQGVTCRAIARTLSQLQISTKCRGRAWHPEMVRRILTPKYVEI